MRQRLILNVANLRYELDVITILTPLPPAPAPSWQPYRPPPNEKGAPQPRTPESQSSGALGCSDPIPAHDARAPLFYRPDKTRGLEGVLGRRFWGSLRIKPAFGPAGERW